MVSLRAFKGLILKHTKKFILVVLQNEFLSALKLIN